VAASTQGEAVAGLVTEWILTPSTGAPLETTRLEPGP
jgi:hypothetical protein